MSPPPTPPPTMPPLHIPEFRPRSALSLATANTINSTILPASPPATPTGGKAITSWTTDTDDVFPLPYLAVGSRVTDEVVVGAGAWSEVTRGMLNPGGGVVAVKRPRPTEAQARSVLWQEAQTLAHVSRAAAWGAPRRRDVAEFVAFDAASGAVLMTFVEGLTLADWSCRSNAADRIAHWFGLSVQLADAFCWLKTGAVVVHGDVKWDNVIVTSQLVPVIVDFSSAHVVVEGVRPPPISAVTDDFAAPELLEAFLPRKRADGIMSPPDSPTTARIDDVPWPVPTFASDVYGLATTLLCAALGETVYAGAPQRYVGIYARQGEPLQWACQKDRNLSLVGPRTVIGKALKGCFGRSAERRVGVEELRDRLAQLAQ